MTCNLRKLNNLRIGLNFIVMNKRVALVIFIFFIVGNVIAQKKYNVLFIAVDDLRPTIGAYDDEFAKTPAMDRLAEESQVFDRAYSNQAVCIASRYNLLLGARSTSTGLYDFGRAFRDYYPDAVTMPENFKNNDYYSAAIGKVFHVGHGTYNDEQSWSAPHFYDNVVEYAAKNRNGRTREEALFENASWEEASVLPKGAPWECLDIADEAYADGRVANEAVSRLAELSKTAKPFFLAVGFARPHLPFTVPKKYWDLYNPDDIPMPSQQTNPVNSLPFAVKRDGEILQYLSIPNANEADPFPDSLTRKLIHGYYAGVSYVDEQIAKLLHQLKETGLDSQTIVVIWGDHGYLLGEMGMWTKHVNYELANRIPLMVRVPELKGKKIDALIETVDIFPTLTEFCGLPELAVPQPIDGVSYASFLKGHVSEPRQYVYHCFPRGGKLGRAIRTDRYRLVAWQKIDQSDKPQYELFDYRNGLIEKENIWDEKHPAFLTLKAMLDRELKPQKFRPVSKRKIK